MADGINDRLRNLGQGIYRGDVSIGDTEPSMKASFINVHQCVSAPSRT
jgi:hypothetical protein